MVAMKCAGLPGKLEISAVGQRSPEIWAGQR